MLDFWGGRVKLLGGHAPQAPTWLRPWPYIKPAKAYYTEYSISSYTVSIDTNEVQ